MAVICPTILADNPHTYRAQLERIEPFADRIQIDLTDGELAETITINPLQAYWPTDIVIDMHIMYREPEPHLEKLIDMKPSMIILHAEAAGEMLDMLHRIGSAGIRSGIALLKETRVEEAKQLIEIIDHVLIFSGDLGKFGGRADFSQLEKISQIKEINRDLEIGWDGGVNADNVKELAMSGVDVINVGGYIQKSEDPQVAYDILNEKLQ